MIYVNKVYFLMKNQLFDNRSVDLPAELLLGMQQKLECVMLKNICL